MGRRLRASGVAAALADAINHPTIEMTMRYAHLSPKMKVNAVKTLDALFARPATDVAEARVTAIRAARKNQVNP